MVRGRLGSLVLVLLLALLVAVRPLQARLALIRSTGFLAVHADLPGEDKAAGLQHHHRHWLWRSSNLPLVQVHKDCKVGVVDGLHNLRS